MRKWTQRRFGAATREPAATLLISAVVLAVLVAPFAFAAGEGRPIDGGKRNPSSNKSLAYTQETGILTAERHLRHPPVQQEGRRRRRGDLRLPQRPRP